MPRTGPFIHQVHIADGFADDCDELVHRCMKVENLNYQTFCSIWKQMNMGCLYEGRTLGAEIAELSEEVIHIAKHYMLKNTENFEESVAGLFIVYALLNLQPYPGFACLRVVPEDVRAIDRIEFVARREKRHDVLYILASVLIKGPVQYQAAEREHGMEHAIRKYLEGYTSIDRLGVRPKGVFYRQNEELDIIRELDTLTRKYTIAKTAISESVQNDRNLKYINDNLSNELQTSLKRIISGMYEEDNGFVEKEVSHVEEDKIYSSRQAIKEKAMKQDVNPVRHLMNEEERRKASSTVPKKNSPNVLGIAKRRPRKRKIKTDIFDNLTNAERKRRIPISPRAIKKIHNSDLETCKDEDSDENTNKKSVSDKDQDKIKCDPIDLLDKLKTDNDKEVITDADESKQIEHTEDISKDDEQELDIQIDTLPVFIRTEDQGKLYEIEIIDSLRHKNDEPHTEPSSVIERKYERKLSALKKISLMPGLSLKKIVNPQEIQPEPSTSNINDLANITEITETESNGWMGNKAKTQPQKMPGIQQPDKRDMKRVHLQSKLKRLGMLPIANFKAPEDLETMIEDEDTGDGEPVDNLDLDLIEN